MPPEELEIRQDERNRVIDYIEGHLIDALQNNALTELLEDAREC